MRLPNVNVNVNVKWTDKQMWTRTELDYEQPEQQGLMGDTWGEVDMCAQLMWSVKYWRKSWTTVLGCVNDGNHFDDQKENE